MIERLRSLRDALDAAIEALSPLDAVLAAWGADTVQARAQGTTTRPNGSASPGEATMQVGGASGPGVATCRHCGGRFAARRRGGPAQVYCGRTCRQRAHAKARQERGAVAGTKPAEAAPDTTVLPDRIDRPFRSPTRYHGDPPEAVRERERHLELPSI